VLPEWIEHSTSPLPRGCASFHWVSYHMTLFTGDAQKRWNIQSFLIIFTSLILPLVSFASAYPVAYPRGTTVPKEMLSAKFVATAAKPKKEREFYWDERLPGFGLMITANGARSYVVQYRNADGVSRRITINGSRKFATAKREAKAILGKVAHGGDPLADKRKQREARAHTLRRIVQDEYLADSDVKKLRSVKAKQWTFERYIFPTLGSRPIAEIKRSEIVRMLRNIKTKYGYGAADDAFKMLSRFFTWYVPNAEDDFRSPIVRGTWSQKGTAPGP
jgi:hypothetical protein